MSDVPQQSIMRAVEHPVQCNRQFHNSKIGAEMAPRLGNVVDQEVAYLRTKLFELIGAEGVKIRRPPDLRQQGHDQSGYRTPRRKTEGGSPRRKT